MISLAALGVGRRAEWRHQGQLARGGDGCPSCARAASAVQVQTATNRYPGCGGGLGVVGALSQGHSHGPFKTADRCWGTFLLENDVRSSVRVQGPSKLFLQKSPLRCIGLPSPGHVYPVSSCCSGGQGLCVQSHHALTSASK